MIVVMRAGSAQDEVQAVSERLTELGFSVNAIYGVERTVIGAVGHTDLDKVDAMDQLRSFGCVDDVIFVSKPYKFVAREYRPEGSIVDIDGVLVGGEEIVVMAGPCTVESESQIMQTAAAVSRAGATVLRGGAYKPCTSPYSFQGMGVPALELLAAAGKRFGLKVITEVMDPRKVDLVGQYADIFQIGTRNMQNYDLLKEVGLAKKPVLLKRGMSAKIEEWLLAAEYIMSAGNENVMLCERGIRSFDSATRNILDLSAVPFLKQATHLPVIVDPSHGTGKRSLVGPMCKAAIACGADGLLIEVHPNPDKALKDGAQSLDSETFYSLMPEFRAVAEAVQRVVGHSTKSPV